MIHWHSLSAAKALEELRTSSTRGLSHEEATSRLATYGANRLISKKKKSILHRFLLQFKDFMIIILLVAAAISYGSARYSGENGSPDAFIILAIVLLNAILGVIQEERAEHSLEALKQMSSPHAQVLRDGRWELAPTETLVPGDIIKLETGSILPADARLIESVELKTQESALTGESEAIQKDASSRYKTDCPLAERSNLVLAGTHVAYGHGNAVVIRTGMDTELGKIASMIQDDTPPDTPLQKRLASLGKVLGLVALFICLLVFLLGIRQSQNPLTMFLTSVSLAVAAIPEGLPAIVTIMLSLGVQRMAKKKAVIRKLPAVETLGSATVICSDKTGTLTQNCMQVTTVSHADSERILLGASICNNASLTDDGKAMGEPTEVALLQGFRDYCVTNRLTLSTQLAPYQRLREIPFDSTRKRMSVLCRVTGNASPSPYLVVAKGAPEMLLPHCTHYRKDDGSVHILTSTIKRQIEEQNQQYAMQALRVIGVASLALDSPPSPSQNFEQNLVWDGMVGMMDPPREEVKQCVFQCKQAGILPVMITGDQPSTALAIGQSLGMATKEEEVLTGASLDQLTDEELAQCIYHYRIFARVTPRHKVRIVKAFQSHGEIVAMTGDGVNDAPALKAADIGCAMGRQGTDVAKGASDMILTDDNFATIVSAIREGRGIYANIQKAIHFLLSCNIGEILTIFAAILFGLPTPLLPIHLLWVNLITDSFPAIALGREPAEPDIMKRAPRAPSSGIFSGGMGFQITVEGFLIGSLALLAYLSGIRLGTNDAYAQGTTMCFAVLGLSQLFHSFNMRSSHSLRHIGFTSNPSILLAFALCAFLQLSVILVPALRAVFHTTLLSPLQWGIVCTLSILPIPLVELEKKV